MEKTKKLLVKALLACAILVFCATPAENSIFAKSGCYKSNPNDADEIPWKKNLAKNKTGEASFGEALLQSITSTCANTAIGCGYDSFAVEAVYTKKTQQCLEVGLSDEDIIPNSSFTASSHYDKDYLPHYARFSSDKPGWAPKYDKGEKGGKGDKDDKDEENVDHYLQIDLGKVFSICTVATKGDDQHEEYVKKYRLLLSLDGITWSSYKEHGSEKIFDGNDDDTGTETNTLLYPAIGRFVRFYPTEYNKWPTTKLEFYYSPDYSFSWNCGFFNNDQRSFLPLTNEDCYSENISNCTTSSLFCVGYSGSYYVYRINEDIDDCSPNPCQNSGTCIDGVNFYNCACVAGYTGINCGTNIDDCSSNPCQNRETCIDGLNTYNCACVAGYTGVNCDTNIDDCSPNPCQNSGTCIDGLNTYNCACVAGYTGVNCDTNIDDCSPNPCQNSGTCIDGLNTYNCACVAGYTEVNCGTNINDCSPNPCQNGGTCIDGVNTYSCLCEASFSGVNCENVNGSWSNWSIFGPCSVTCDGGTQTRNRSCTNPPPAGVGLDCTGDFTETRLCNTHDCPVINGSWSNWSSFGPCNASCGGGTQARSRTCTNPPPSGGGLECVGQSDESQLCNMAPCPVIDGSWSNWSYFGPCNASCGGGTQARSRTCTNPPPSGGGLDCDGLSDESQSCNMAPCRVDGSWSNWSTFGPCNESCGSGTQMRNRSCTNPPPSGGGLDCVGQSDESQLCNMAPCPVIDGSWSNWSSFGPCNASCGGGTRFRNRSCTNPPPSGGGLHCVGQSDEIKTCNMDSCTGKFTTITPTKTTAFTASTAAKISTSPTKTTASASATETTSSEPSTEATLSQPSTKTTASTLATETTASTSATETTASIPATETTASTLATETTASTVTVLQPQVTRSLIISALPTSSTSIIVMWTENPSNLQNETLTGYSIMFFKTESGFASAKSKNISVFPNGSYNYELNGLGKFVSYTIQVARITADHSNYSEPVTVTTNEDKPSAPPSYITFDAPTPTSLMVRWKSIPRAHRNGVMLGYRVTYHTVGDNNTINILNVSLGTTLIFIDKLEKHANYCIIVMGYNRIGDGPGSKDIIPAGKKETRISPKNVTALNYTSLDTIPISWKPIEDEVVVELLIGYRVSYKLLSVGGESVDEPTMNFTTRKETREIIITGLDNFGYYQINVTGVTRKGDTFPGISFGVTCRCQRTFRTNWNFFPPYVDNSTVKMTNDSATKVSGIMPAILEDFIDTCCMNCKLHGRSTVTFFNSEDGPEDKYQKRDNNEVKSKIGNGTDLSFPVYGWKGQATYHTYFRYIPLVESPGVVFIVNTDSEEPIHDSMVQSTFKTLPLIGLCLTMSLTAGILIWILDRTTNRGNFAPSFVNGSSQGLWLSLVTVTTVGYGDLTPKSPLARMFTVLWISVGLVIYGLFISEVTTSLTTVVLKTDYRLYGTKVGAIRDSPEHRFALLKNADVNKDENYSTFEDMYNALKSKAVQGIVLDALEAGVKSEILNNQQFKMHSIYDFSSTYGIVLSGHSTKLRQCSRGFMQAKRAKIFARIAANTHPIVASPIPSSVIKSTRLFDSTSPIYLYVLYSAASALCLAFCLGLLWELRRGLVTVHPAPKTGNDIQTAEDYKNVLKRELKQLHTELLENLENIKRKLLVKHMAQWRAFYANLPLHVESLDYEEYIKSFRGLEKCQKR